MKTSPKATVPAACFFVMFGYIAWQIHKGSGEFRLDRGYKVDIVVHGPNGEIIPATGRAPR